MKTKTLVYRLLVAIAAITAVSGLVQMLGARFMLGLLNADTAPAAAHFFAIVGMFMLLFGGLLLHALLSPGHHPLVLIWTGLQKIGAFVFVGLGVMNEVFSVLALGVAFFDLASGLLIFWYWTLVAVAAISTLAGVVLMIAPGFVMQLMAAPRSPTTDHFFVIIGMFIFLFGGLFFHALWSPKHHPVVLLWIIFEKVGATTMVALGVLYSFFAPLALALAGYDLLSGLLALVYWRQISVRNAG